VLAWKSTLLIYWLEGWTPKDRVRGYIGAAKGFLEHAREELEKGNIRQVAEKVWGATVLAIRAYAEWRESS